MLIHTLSWIIIMTQGGVFIRQTIEEEVVFDIDNPVWLKI
jgi:hypothetical protein